MARLQRLVLVGAVALCVSAGTGLALSVAEPQSRTSSGSVPGALLPDLDPVVPGGLTTETVGSGARRRWRLGFRSATENAGAGPLIVEAGRSSRTEPSMSADQVLETRGRGRIVRRDVGRLRFVRSPDHRHWHYLRFMRYELRTAREHRLVAPDRKSGFCLGDRYDARGAPPAQPSEPAFTGHCNRDRDPDALSVREGISVGYGDDYAAQLEGQYVDITTLPSGRYVLVHRANADGALRERTLANNASSLLISLRWRGIGSATSPVVRRLAACPDLERCRRKAARGSQAVRLPGERALPGGARGDEEEEPDDEGQSGGGHDSVKAAIGGGMAFRGESR